MPNPMDQEDKPASLIALECAIELNDARKKDIEGLRKDVANLQEDVTELRNLLMELKK